MAYLEFSDRELATVFSALRYWQAGIENSGARLPEFTSRVETIIKY